MKDAAEAEMSDGVGSCFDDPMQPAAVASYSHCCDLQGALLKILTDIDNTKGSKCEGAHSLANQSITVCQPMSVLLSMLQSITRVIERLMNRTGTTHIAHWWPSD